MKEHVKLYVRDIRDEFNKELETVRKRVEALEFENQKLKSQLGEHKKTIATLKEANNVPANNVTTHRKSPSALSSPLVPTASSPTSSHPSDQLNLTVTPPPPPLLN
ncbi:hypothetical protein BaRGS_00022227 [Batillaria attramentaria]|uniref:Uncharacterized protein n=1 Tax=Batillaria attramentaria TaxID=370345 RepID=A0ABD0KHZ2_9CAEN